MTAAVVPVLAQWLEGALPSALRIVGLVVLAPGLSYQQAPPQVRVALAVGLAIIIAPMASPPPGAPAEPLAFIGLCISELALGLSMGFVAAALLEALRFGGEVLDLQIGLRAGQLFDPTSGAQSGILSTAYAMLGLLLFVTIDGHHWLLRGLAASFGIIPAGGMEPGVQLGALAADLGTSVLLLGLQVAGPVMAALLLADLAFGLVARAVPQINVFLVGIPGKIALAFALAAVSLPSVVIGLERICRLMAQYLDATIRTFGG